METVWFVSVQFKSCKNELVTKFGDLQLRINLSGFRIEVRISIVIICSIVQAVHMHMIYC